MELWRDLITWESDIVGILVVREEFTVWNCVGIQLPGKVI